jgi:hypothetical protein
LKYNLIDSTAWRVDFSDVFEKFVQYIFKEVTKETGGQLFTNYKFYSKTKRNYSWELKYIEPDAIYQKDNVLIFIDAKYKSNLYNKFAISENLKDEHRHDLHQIMAYSAFSDTNLKYGALCYPSHQFEIKKLSYMNRINDAVNTIWICGIPLKKVAINDARKFLSVELNNI